MVLVSSANGPAQRLPPSLRTHHETPKKEAALPAQGLEDHFLVPPQWDTEVGIRTLLKMEEAPADEAGSLNQPELPARGIGTPRITSWSAEGPISPVVVISL